MIFSATATVAQEVVRIGHISQVDDTRYSQDWGYARLVLPPRINTVQAVEMAISDMSFVADVANISFELVAVEVENLQAAQTMISDMATQEIGFVILDLPFEMVREIASNFDRPDMVLINTTAPNDTLRQVCAPWLLHSGPSNRMKMDSFAQFLRFSNWTKTLVLFGENPADQTLVDAFEFSAKRMGISIVDARSFTLSANPSRRNENNIRLLTANARYDAVFVADSRGEFGRFIPYATTLPRPTIGSVGLVSTSWHWAFERDGATQVSSRFDRYTGGRKMSEQDWANWMAAKSVMNAYVKNKERTPVNLANYLRSDRVRLDGSKGVAMSYRSWNGQLRMPLLLATADAVIAVTPMDGFLHRTNNLDTLGVDEPEASAACDN